MILVHIWVIVSLKLTVLIVKYFVMKQRMMTVVCLILSLIPIKFKCILTKATYLHVHSVFSQLITQISAYGYSRLAVKGLNPV
jgi:hypothetical protein